MKKIDKGFTIMELLLVILILSLLYAIAAFHVSGLQNEARIARSKGDLKTLRLALDTYIKNNRGCPSEEDYQTVLLDVPSRIIEKNLMDPFGATNNTLYPYSISDNGRYYVVYSIGPKKNGYSSISDGGVVLIEGFPIFETNGYF